MPLDQALVREVAERLRSARSVLWITGAGISADSGLPTYRGVGGLYDGEDTIEGMPIEEALSGEVFARRPELTWKYIAQIEAACRGARPNAAHEIIARSESSFDRVWVLTQNVDGLHRLAGSQAIIDIHGDLYDLYCTHCESRLQPSSFEGYALPPLCDECQGIMRPDVVLFGELLPTRKVAVLNRELQTGFDAVFSIGTTSVFPYIAEPVLRARMNRQLCVEINPTESEVSDVVEYRLRAGAQETISAIWDAFSATG